MATLRLQEAGTTKQIIDPNELVIAANRRDKWSLP
jgi:hypothetical protein